MTRRARQSPRLRKPQEVLIDANLMLLLLVGLDDPRSIPQHKRTAAYRQRDFGLLLSLLKPFERIVTTPNILSEVTNLASQTNRWLRENAFISLARLASSLEERYFPSTEFLANPHLAEFGLTDLGIVKIAQGGCLVITADSRLADYALRQGLHVVNFLHIRE